MVVDEADVAAAIPPVAERDRRQLRPVAPVYAPETAAAAILKAAAEGRREYRVGSSTPVAILGDALLPTLADRYLAWTGFQGQDRKQKLASDRRDNLFAPAATGLHQVLGSFGKEARGTAMCVGGQAARGATALGTLLLAGLGGAALARWLARR